MDCWPTSVSLPNKASSQNERYTQKISCRWRHFFRGVGECRLYLPDHVLICFKVIGKAEPKKGEYSPFLGICASVTSRQIDERRVGHEC